MERPYVDYKNSVLWKRIDYDWAYWYQCVDLFKDYCDKVLGEKFWKTGNANEIRINKYNIFWNNRAREIWTQNLMQGDILVRWTNVGYHIAIFDHKLNWNLYVLEQNGSGKNSGDWLWPNAIRMHAYKPAFFSWIYRSLKIINNYNKEVEFIENKINTQGEDTNTLEYAQSIRIF